VNPAANSPPGPAAVQAQIETLQGWIDDSRRAVFFGGAGVSTESGIPDFRSAEGIYAAGGPIPPEVILSRSFFETHPEEFFEFYRAKVLHPEAKPNPAHLKLAELERAGRLSAVVTQNIDGLHQAAGSANVLELHGSAQRNRCRACGRAFRLDEVYAAQGVPRCGCDGIVQPDVVLYEDPLDQNVLQAAARAVAAADLLIIGGTSLVVYPAAGLVDYYRGERLAVINRDGAGADRRSALSITEPIGRVLAQIKATPAGHA
jgi:NAD-dependent deacetylase